MSTGRNAPEIKDPDPSPQPIEGQILAKDQTKKQAKKKGRSSQIFAGQLNRQVLDFGKTRTGE